MVLAQEVENLFGLGGLGERGVAAQIAEHYDNLAAVTFEDFLVALGDNQLGKLRCQKALQPSDPSEFVDLGRNPRLQLPVPPGYLVGARSEFAEQARVLDRNHRLIGEDAD